MQHQYATSLRDLNNGWVSDGARAPNELCVPIDDMEVGPAAGQQAGHHGQGWCTVCTCRTPPCMGRTHVPVY